MQEGYDVKELALLNDTWLSWGTSLHLRTRLDFMMGHSMMSRSEIRRRVQLPDLFCVRWEREGFTECGVLVVISDQGKTNQNGRVEYGAAMRHKDPRLCTVSALAAYLFTRWHQCGEVFPDFSHRRNWYDLLLLRGGQATTEMAYTTQAKHVRDALIGCGIVSSKCTHITRGSSARIAEANGASDAQIRRAGHWSPSIMEKCYLTSLPREAIRALAEFPVNGREFWLARAAVVPDDTLLRQVFPGVEKGLQQLDDSEVIELAGGGFLRLLLMLRVVLLQDSAVLMDMYPSSGLWQHRIFHTPEFMSFKSRLESVMAGAIDPVQTQIHQLAPGLASLVEGGLKGVVNSMATMEEAIMSKISSLSAIIPELASKVSQVEEKVDRGRVRCTSCQQSFTCMAVNTQSSLSEARGKLADLDDHIANSPLELPIDSGLDTRSASYPPDSHSGSEPLNRPAVSTLTHDELPAYTLSKALGTVNDVWAEYANGLGAGPSVKSLEERWGSSWRRNPTESHFFRRRRHVYRAIEAVAMKAGIGETKAASLMEARRQRMGLSIAQLMRKIETVKQDVIRKLDGN